MEEAESSNAAKAVDEVEWADPSDLAPRPFDDISENLRTLGALSIEDFLVNATSSTENLDVSFHLQLPSPLTAEKPNDTAGESAEPQPDPGSPIKPVQPRGLLAAMHSAAHRAFGSTESLKFEFIEEDPKNKECIFTITRPNGLARSYKSGSGFSRRSDAKGQAVRIASEMGAVDFIYAGDSDAVKAKKGLLLNPLDVEVDSVEADEAVVGEVPKFSIEEEGVRKIEDCCLEWRAGTVKPHWVVYNDAKNKKKFGMALRITLSPHIFRAYAVQPMHDTSKAAKMACAEHSLDEDVLEFIKYGNGQKEPLKLEDDEFGARPSVVNDAIPPLKGISLQEFFDTLPQPFPESIGTSIASEINAPSWLNTTLQSARGERLASHYIPIVDGGRHLHGSILRIERPGETKTYIVDPQFPKRYDAKSAVCLLAMSQGVGDYIRQLKEAGDNKLPADRRKLANEKLLQVLAAECSKVRQGNRLTFDFTNERDAFGCALKVDISANAAEPDIREYCVKSEYRTKADAKAAVACHAAEQGLVDILRFRGGSLPDDYVPFWEAQVNGGGDNYVGKRKDIDRDLDGEGRDRKKRRKGAKDSSPQPGESSSIKLPRPTQHQLPPKPMVVPQPTATPVKSSWKKPNVTASNGLAPTNGHASASRSVGQDRPGHRGAGGSLPMHPHVHPMNSPATPSFPPPPYQHDARTGYGPGPVYQLPPPVPHHAPYPAMGHPPSHPVPMHYPNPAYHSSPPPPPPQSMQPHPYPGYYATPQPGQPQQPVPVPYPHYSYPHYPQPYPAPPPPHPPSQLPPPQSYPPSYPPPSMYGHSPPPPPMMTPYTPGPSQPLPPHPHPPPYVAPRSPHSPRSPPHPSMHHPSYAQHQDTRYHSAKTRNDRDNYQNGYYQADHTEPRPYYHGADHQPAARPNDEHRGPPLPGPRHFKQNHSYAGPQRSPVKEEYQDSYLGNHGHGNNHNHNHGGHHHNHSHAGHYRRESKPKFAPNSNVADLHDFCAKKGIMKPIFQHQVKVEEGVEKFMVWAEKGSQRLEIDTLFWSLAEGQARLAKQVLQWERANNGKS